MTTSWRPGKACAVSLAIFLLPLITAYGTVSWTFKNKKMAINLGENAETTTFKVSSSAPPEGFSITTDNYLKYNVNTDSWIGDGAWNSSRTEVDPSSGSFSLEAPDPKEISIKYSLSKNEEAEITALAAGIYKFDVNLLNSSSVELQSGTITITIVDPKGSVTEEIPNVDMVFDRPVNTITDPEKTQGVIETFAAWGGAGAPGQNSSSEVFADGAGLTDFRLWNTGTGNIEVFLTNVEFKDDLSSRPRPFDWIDYIGFHLGENPPDENWGTELYTWAGGVKAFEKLGSAPGISDTAPNNVATLRIRYVRTVTEYNDDHKDLLTLPTGTYVADVTVTARSPLTGKTANEVDGEEKTFPYTLRVVLRVGPRLEVNDTGSIYYMPAYDFPIMYVEATKGTDATDKVVSLSMERGTTWQWKPTVGIIDRPTFNVTNTKAEHSNLPTPDNTINSNQLIYSLKKSGTEETPDSSWFRIRPGDENGVLKGPAETNTDSTSNFTIEFSTSNLDVGDYHGFIYIDGKDYFGNPCANDNVKFNMDNPSALPTLKDDVLAQSNFIKVNLRIVGPAFATNAESGISHTIAAGSADSDSNPERSTFELWNTYGTGILHYSYGVVYSSEDAGKNWLNVTTSDSEQTSEGVGDKNIITAHYDASGLRPGLYKATIRFTDEMAANSPYDVQVELKVLGSTIATSTNVLSPICDYRSNATNDTTFKIWNADTTIGVEGVDGYYGGSILEYTIVASSDEGWLSVDPTSGQSEGPQESQKDIVAVSYNTSDLPFQETRTGKITITNSTWGTTKDINVTLTMRASTIAVNRDTIERTSEYGKLPDPVEFSLWNSATTDSARLEYSTSIKEENVDWLEINDIKGPPYISEGPNDVRPIEVVFLKSDLSPGTYEATIVITGTTATNSPVEIPVKLVVEGSIISLSTANLTPKVMKKEDANKDTFQVWNSSGYGMLDYTVKLADQNGDTENAPKWLTCNPLSGTSESAVDKQTINVIYSTASLEPGTYQAQILVEDPNSTNLKQTIDVVLIVQQPSLRVKETSLKYQLTAAAASQTFQVWNGSTGAMSFTVAKDKDWITLDKTSGTSASATDKAVITATCNPAGAGANAPGTNTGTITVTAKDSNGDLVGTQDVAVTMTVGAVIQLNTTSIAATCNQGGSKPDNMTFTIKNGGVLPSTLKFLVTESATWIKGISCTSQTIGSDGYYTSNGERVTFELEFDNSVTTEARKLTANITIANKDGSSDETLLPVTVWVVGSAQIALWNESGTAIAPENELKIQQGKSGNFKFLVSNTADGVLDYSIAFSGFKVKDDKGAWVDTTTYKNWLSADSTTGSVSGTTKDPRILTCNAAQLPGGYYKATVTVSGNATDSKTFDIICQSAEASVTLSPDTLVPGDWNSGQPTSNNTFKATPFGIDNLTFVIGVDYITGDSGWIKEFQDSATGTTLVDNKITLNGDAPKDVKIVFDTSKLSTGSYEARVKLSYTGASTISSNSLTVTLNIEPDIAVDPESFNRTIGANESGKETFQIWNSGLDTLNYTAAVTEGSDWLSIESGASGSSTGPDNKKTVALNYTSTGQAPGLHTGKVTITNKANSKTKDITFDMTVNASQISAPSSVEVSANVGATGTQTMTITNTGSGYLGLTIAASDSDGGWLSVSPTSASGTNSVDVTVTGNATNLTKGKYTGTITITDSSADNSPVTVPVTFYVGIGQISVSADSLSPEFTQGDSPTQSTFTVSNTGNGTLNYNISYQYKAGSTEMSWISSISPSEGQAIAGAAPSSITVVYDISSLDSGTYEATITVSDKDTSQYKADSKEIKVTLKVNRLIPVGGLVVELGDKMTRNTQGSVSFWQDQSGFDNNGRQTKSSRQPQWSTDVINAQPALSFDKKSMIEISSVRSDSGSKNRSAAIMFKTGFDVVKPQTLFAVGDVNAGMNAVIDDQEVIMSAWGEWGTTSVTSGVKGDTPYYIFMVVDVDNAQLTVYVNGKNIAQEKGGAINTSTESIGIGDAPAKTFSVGKTPKGLMGYIAEFYYYDSALSSDEASNLDSYFENKYKVSESQVDIRTSDMAIWLRADSGVEYDGETLVEWLNREDTSKKGARLKQSSKDKRPRRVTNVANSMPGVRFDGIQQYMDAKNNTEINANSAGYREKTIFVVFKTSNDVSSRQMIWAQGDKKVGLNIYIEGTSVNLGAWDLKKSGWVGAVSGGTLTTDTTYCVQMTLNSNGIEGAINGGVFGTDSNSGILGKHGPAVMGMIKRTSLINGEPVKKGDYFAGDILEFIMYNATPTDDEVLKIETYLRSRYGLIFE